MSNTSAPQSEDIGRYTRSTRVDQEDQLSAFAELVASFRNEIYDPLAVLMGQTQLLLREDLSNKLRRRAEMIESQAKEIEEIVSRMGTVPFGSARD